MTVLGATYSDRVTGFVGVATTRAEYLTGIPRVCLEPKVVTPSELVQPQWFDEVRLERFGDDLFDFENVFK